MLPEKLFNPIIIRRRGQPAAATPVIQQQQQGGGPEFKWASQFSVKSISSKIRPSAKAVQHHTVIQNREINRQIVSLILLDQYLSQHGRSIQLKPKYLTQLNIQINSHNLMDPNYKSLKNILSIKY
mgnify:CR=1 FL=1